MPLFKHTTTRQRSISQPVIQLSDPLHPYIHPSPAYPSAPSPKRRKPPVVKERDSSLYSYNRGGSSFDLVSSGVSNLDIGSLATSYDDHLPRVHRPWLSSVDLGQTKDTWAEELEGSFGGATLTFPLPPTLYTRLCASQSLDILPLTRPSTPPPQQPIISIDPAPRRIYTPPRLEENRAPLWSRQGGRPKGFLAKLRRLSQTRFHFGKMSDAPPIPPRSEARSARSPLELQPAFQLQEQHTLPVDLPLPLSPTLEDTPSLSSGSSSGHGSPNGTLHSPLPITQKVSRESFLWGHKKNKKSQDNSKDPYRIKDGAEKLPPASGVYTPITFPGPRPSPSLYDTPRTPSDGYTPSSGPSRSTSISSAGSLSAFSVYPESRFSYVRGKTLEHLKRVTNTVASYTTPSPTASSTSLTPVTPASARDSYFSTYSWSASSRQSSQGSQISQLSSQGPTTPTTSRPFASLPYPSSPATGTGLGFFKSPEGVLPEHMARPEGGAAQILFDDSGEIIGVVSPQSTPQAKGKRKPVPRVHSKVDEDFEGLSIVDEHEQVHAL